VPPNDAAQLQQALDTLLADSAANSILLLSRDTALAAELDLPADTVRMTTLEDAAELEPALRCDLAVVVRQLEQMPIQAGLALLARLRDLHTDTVLLHTSNAQLCAQEMLALGFVPAEACGPGRWFCYQRDQFFERRAWNSPEQWAHPQNFRRNRW
jgi:Family of unknown function (DUF6231)